MRGGGGEWVGPLFNFLKYQEIIFLGTLLTYIFSEHLPLAFHFVWGPRARGKFSVPRKHLGLAFYFVWGPPGGGGPNKIEGKAKVFRLPEGICHKLYDRDPRQAPRLPPSIFPALARYYTVLYL